MRRVSFYLLVTVVLSLIAAPAFAAITGTAHQTTSGSGGCGACHIPHGGTTSTRLWPVNPSTSGLTFRGVTSTLCASCHYSLGAYGTTYSSVAQQDNQAYGGNSHGVRMANTGNFPAATVVLPGTTGLPYGDQTGGYFECTTCHDVHNDTSRPFLRTSIDALCVRCHNTRYSVSGTWTQGSAVTAIAAWGGLTNMHNVNPGSHPIGTDITGEMDSPADSPIVWPAQARIAKNAISGGWSVGGHTDTGSISGGGVTCNTCHAVHGVNKDQHDTVTTATITTVMPTVNMLLIGQNTGANEADTTGRSVANGDTNFNPLCEACHINGTMNWNPGATSFSHPVDNQAGTWGAPYLIPQYWPKNATSKAICESCHSPHTQANKPNRTNTILATANPYILRASTSEICDSCHNGRIARHHPVGNNISTALTGAASYLRTGGNAAGNTMGCGTCHAGGNGAHNWTSAGGGGIGINPNWRPLNNARDNTMGTDRYAASPNTVTSENISATCVDCHLAMSQSVAAGSLSPTLHRANGLGADNVEYTHLGEGSHMIGAYTAGFLNVSVPIRALDGRSATTWNPTTAAWTTALFGAGKANGGWSRFGGTSAAPILVCESCHELEMDRNVSTHLLLADYYEGESATLNSSVFCEGCHGVPTGTHPMYLDNIARTKTTLDTTINTTTRPWIRTGAPKATPPTGVAGTSTWISGGPGTGSMACEACHQPHDAATNGYSLIIEAPSANVSGGTTVAVTQTGYFGGGTIAQRTNKLRSQGTLPDTSLFCDQCHAYK